MYIIKKLLFILLYISAYVSITSAEFIKELKFEWEDGNPAIYRKWGSVKPNISNSDKNRNWGGEAFLKTLTVTGEDGITRTIDAKKDFIFPDTYKFNSPMKKFLYYTKTTGYYQCVNAPKSNKCINKKTYITIKDGTENIPETEYNWNTLAKAAFSSPNLNFYIGGSNYFYDDTMDGSDFSDKNSRDESTVRHLLSYTNGVKVGFAGDGYVIVTERGGNNSFYLLARDMDGNELGDIYIKRARGNHCSNDKNTPYIATGRMQENFQEICAAVAPIQDLAPSGSTIGSIEMWAASDDPGDGKVMLVHSLEKPKVCYDYSVRQSGHTIPSKDRNLTALSPGDLSISLGLRSIESDYDMEHVKLKLEVPLAFKNALYSPNGVNKFVAAKYIVNSTPHIAFGANAAEGKDGGGTIQPNEHYFAQFNYANSTGAPSQIQFNFDLNITVDTTEKKNNPIVYLLTTDEKKYSAQDSPYTQLTRCPVSQRYNPQWGVFNVERLDSGQYNHNQPNEKYPLYTQVSGKPFDVSVAFYEANSSGMFSPFTKEIKTSTHVELEMIDVSSYNDAATFFRCNDPNQEILKAIVKDMGTERSLFVSFNDQSRVNIQNKISTDEALENTAFRLWQLVDNKNKLIRNPCKKRNDNKCHQKLYNDVIAAYDYKHSCENCSGYEGGCYQCLRDHFGKPICSRDNFAIRPASYKIAISDTNQSSKNSADIIQLTTNVTSESVSLVSGYKYQLDANATLYNSDNAASGYSRLFHSDNKNDLFSTLHFESYTGMCPDTTDGNISLYFENGKLLTTGEDRVNALFTHNNVGFYTLHIEDNNWTLVDQKRYQYKTFPESEECIIDSASITAESSLTYTSKSGCRIQTNSEYNKKVYTDLPLQFTPYTFGLNDISLITRPDNNNILFMNDLSDKYYDILFANLYMATSFEGNITALSSEGTLLTNFTDECAASNIELSINHTINREDSTLQKYLMINLNKTAEVNKTISINKSEFNQTNTGQMTIGLHTTVKKPLGLGAELNPVMVRYKTLNASSPMVTANAFMKNDFSAQGINRYNTNITYVYGKVTSVQKLYDNIEKSYQNTPIYVDIFCGKELTDDDCTNNFGLGTNSLGEDETGWKLATIFNNNMLGSTDINVTHFAEKNADPSVIVEAKATTTFAKDVTFNDGNATQNDINISVGNLQRNSMIKVIFRPRPWLKYLLEDSFRLHFTSSSVWAGVGKTGHVTDTQSSSTQNNRMNW